ncbi:trace amine-associated receptor 13c-like [Astatotilapia calliptera]|uniref:trace amine-associated receptor 13c-like n=1 Tax=Astatotilapia calliptera TaxID=8154 RepID=UPI000E42AE17|nr:trace amine-associated receptor 13c-like [Astatotilapia calliptera]
MEKGAELCFPHLFNNSCIKPTLHWSKAVLLNIVLSCISLITAGLNLLVIISVSHFRQLHTPSNILLLSLAVSDFLVGLLLIPAEIFRITVCWVFGESMCSLYTYLGYIVVTSSISNIVLISVDRYVAICDPLHYPSRISVAKIRLSVCMCWFYSAFYSTLCTKNILIEPGRYNSCYGECVFITSDIAGIIDLVLSFIVPVSIIIVLYMRVFVVAVSQARAMHSHVTATLQRSLNQTNKSELKAARTLGVLVVVFLASFCPFYCYFLVVEDKVSDSSASIVVIVYYFNSCLNPLIYALFYPWFRNAVKVIITFQIFKHDSSEVNVI